MAAGLALARAPLREVEVDLRGNTQALRTVVAQPQSEAYEVVSVAEGCTCDTSCTECLDHFHNQHIKSRLDRKLGSALLRYALRNEMPAPATPMDQVRQLLPLSKLLELDGYICELASPGDEKMVPLSVANSKKAVGVRTTPTLLQRTEVAVDESSDMTILIDESRIANDLPGIHADIKTCIGGGG